MILTAALVLSMAVAYVAYLLIESPIAEMQRLILSKPDTRDGSSKSAATGMLSTTTAKRRRESDNSLSYAQSAIGYGKPVDVGDERSSKL